MKIEMAETDTNQLSNYGLLDLLNFQVHSYKKMTWSQNPDFFFQLLLQNFRRVEYEYCDSDAESFFMIMDFPVAYTGLIFSQMAMC